ncbi:hypothetical protein V8G54_004633 [Vigna mungo]|uniref:Uncharacterized protein n=1 Tax=Vigna mungo TaxID=3915 RepID=A0AAQ3SG43_VIGMU
MVEDYNSSSSFLYLHSGETPTFLLCFHCLNQIITILGANLCLPPKVPRTRSSLLMRMLMNRIREMPLTMLGRGETIWWSPGLPTLSHLTYDTIFFGWIVLKL